MKRFLASLTLAAMASGFAGVAHGQSKIIQEADKTVYKKKTILDFNELTLEGDLKMPMVRCEIIKRESTFASLIKLRADFQRELQKSTDNL